MHASQAQVLLASKYGLKISEGQTFVRPHVRGGKARETVFRSKSASMVLFESRTFISSPPVPDAWLHFEKDVYRLMEHFGFSVQHIGKTRAKDEGIDLVATKGQGLDEIGWIIQCKCYSTHRKVEPNTIRELMGVLQQHSRGIRGMVVTTSDFTSGAKKLATENNIVLIAGSTVSNWIEAANQRVQ